MDIERYRVAPGSEVDLTAWDPSDSALFDGDKTEGKAAAKASSERLEELQELLYAEGRRKVLVVLQAMDTGGKDGVIRHVFEGVNPCGVKVASFKKPSSRELAHDYLWRVHEHTPARGEIVVFNRSHYEDVLVVRVRELVPREVWARRYDHINDFERMLADEGVTILKFYLNIDADEQKERLQARLDEPHKNWKFSTGDLEERKLWPEYTAAYEEMLGRTSTEWAPWHCVPANRKWYRNLVIGGVVVDALEGLGMSYPDPEPGLADVVVV